MLEQNGYEAVPAKDGRQALERLSMLPRTWSSPMW
jgi:CheY-like chemotaxis protein